MIVSTVTRRNLLPSGKVPLFVRIPGPASTWKIGCLNNSLLDTLPGKQLEDLMYSPLGNWYNLEILTLAKNS
jgi:hypothetical protein